MASQRYRGLLIGNAIFPRDPHGLPALEGPLADVEELQQALTDDQVGLFLPDDLTTLPDMGVQDLREHCDEFFSTAARQDVLLLYYSGHGELDEHNTLYLCARDSKTGSLRSTALSSIEINNMINGSAAATTIIVLDCCHSGAFKGADLATPVTGRGRYVLTSSRANELARAASEPGQPSPFTDLLVRGLRHADAEGHLTVAELYRQVHRWMTEEGVLAPQLRIAGEGDVVIARREDPSLLPAQHALVPNAAPLGSQDDHEPAQANRQYEEFAGKSRLLKMLLAVGTMVVVAAVVIVSILLARNDNSNAGTPPPTQQDTSSALLASRSSSLTGQTIDGISTNDLEQLAFHIHVHLAIYINGTQKLVPYGIGIVPPYQLQPIPAGNPSAGTPFVGGGSKFYWLHTHDESGVIHIESPEQETFTLGQFFDEWMQPLVPRPRRLAR